MKQEREHMSTLPKRVLSGSPSSGSAPLIVLALLLVLGGFVAYLWLVPISTPAPATGSPVSHTPSDSRTPRERPSSPALAIAERAEAAPTHPAAPTARNQADRFRGRGSLRGTVDTSTGKHFPAEWTLVVEPSRALAGSERAVTRRYEFTADERDFEIPDLPLAGYSVRAEAEGFNGLAAHILLERTSSSAYLMLQLSPAGFVTGQLLDSEGAPVDGIEVWIFPGKAPPLGQSGPGGRQTTTLPDGTWRFDSVLDGPHSLVFGAPIAPLVAPIEINFRAPSLTVPAPKLPELARLEILVIDATQLPVAGASVRGSGSRGGSFDLETPATGTVQLEHLVPGHYRFTISHELYGEARLERRFTGGEDQTEVVVLRERP